MRFVWSVDPEVANKNLTELQRICLLYSPNTAAEVPVRIDDAYLCLHKEGADVLVDLFQDAVALTWN